MLPPAQLDVYGWPYLLTQALLLSFPLLLCFPFGHNCGVAFFENARTCILRYPFTQKKHGDENKDDEGCDNLPGENICRHRAKQWMCKKTTPGRGIGIIGGAASCIGGSRIELGA
jgi:hypothetical protein